jgi:hypothetical protein
VNQSASVTGQHSFVGENWLRADPGLLKRAEGTAVELARVLRAVSGRLDAATPPDWQGRAHRAEQGLVATIQAQLQTLVTVLILFAEALGRLAAELGAAQLEWWQAARAEQSFASWHPDGGLAAQLALAAQVRAAEAAEALESADRRAAAAIAALPRWHVPVPAGAGGAAPAVDIARWWAGLLPAAQAGLFAGTSAVQLANLDGIPESIRDAANRRALAVASASHQHSAGLASLHTALTEPGASRLLFFDPSGDGRAVVGIGPLATAAHLVVLVPGMTTTLTDIDRLVKSAEAVLAACRPQDSLAAVAWLGYDAPSVLQVVSSASARAGATALTSFVAGLRVAHPGSSITVVGHSYGSLVAATAARQGLSTDDLVLVGSPGVGVNRAQQLPDGGRVWAARAEGDPIAAVFDFRKPVNVLALGSMVLTSARPLYRYGTDPTSPRFGATVFRTGADVRGHSEYFTPGSESVRNIERIAAQDPLAVTVRPR